MFISSVKTINDKIKTWSRSVFHHQRYLYLDVKNVEINIIKKWKRRRLEVKWDNQEWNLRNVCLSVSEKSHGQAEIWSSPMFTVANFAANDVTRCQFNAINRTCTQIIHENCFKVYNLRKLERKQPKWVNWFSIKSLIASIESREWVVYENN